MPGHAAARRYTPSRPTTVIDLLEQPGLRGLIEIANRSGFGAEGKSRQHRGQRKYGHSHTVSPSGFHPVDLTRICGILAAYEIKLLEWRI